MLSKSFLSELSRRSVAVEQPDGDRVLLRRVPLRQFNKGATNLLLIRGGQRTPFLALVDDDLQYLGRDGATRAAFSRQAPARKGWRPLVVEVSGELDVALERALRVLGFPSRRAAAHRRPPPYCRLLGEHDFPRTIGREEQIEQVLACLNRQQPCLPMIVGEPGTGKTNLLHEVAGRWSKMSGSDVVGLDIPSFLAVTSQDRAKHFTELLNEIVGSDVVVAIERFELVPCEIYCGDILFCQAQDRGARFMATTLPSWLRHLNCEPLSRRMQPIELPQLSRDDVLAILRQTPLGGIDVDGNCAAAAWRAARDLRGHFPAKGIGLLDAAAALARLRGARLLTPDDVYAAAGRCELADQEQESD